MCCSEYLRKFQYFLDNQLKNGGIEPVYIKEKDSFSNNERTDVLAQTLRLGVYLLNIVVNRPKNLQ